MRVMRIGLFLFYVIGYADAPAHNGVRLKAFPSLPCTTMEALLRCNFFENALL